MDKTEAMALGARCDICPLRKDGVIVPPMPSRGQLRLVVVSEGPSRADEKMGAPLSGMGGKLVWQNLSANGIEKHEVHATSVALCRGDSDRDNDRACDCCAPRLLHEIAALAPGAPILAMGKGAAKVILGARSILTARGFVWKAKDIDEKHAKATLRAAEKKPEGAKRDEAGLKAATLAGRRLIAGRTAVPTLSPGFILRADTWHPVFKIDVARVCRIVAGLDCSALDDSGEYAVGGPELLEGMGPVVSCDIETDGIKPLETKILSVGISDGSKTVVVWPWRRKYASDLSNFLRGRSAVVFHNGYQFDQLVMGARGVSFEGVRLEDTLLAHHAYASHLPQRLAHVVTEYCDSSPWKITHGGRGGEEKGLLPSELPHEELCKYNAADARLTIKSWHRMQGDLAPEMRVYEHDKQLAALCREMSRVGIGVDHERKRELSIETGQARRLLRNEMRRVIGERDFKPGRLGEVRRILFSVLGGAYVGLTSAGLPSTSNATLEALRGANTPLARFAEALLKWRVAGKIKSTYLDAVEINPATGRTHYNWKPFGTVSGRLSCRLQSCPRWDGSVVWGRPREIYVPRQGHRFVYFDVSQAEMRLAAYLSADPVFMSACGSDVHVGNAKNVFPEIAAKGWLEGDAKKDPARGKPFRDIAKNLGFAIAYGAEAEKVFITLRSKGFEVTFRAVELILARLRAAYKVYYRYVETNLEKVRRDGFMRTPLLGRIRWLGWFPKPTDVSNYPVQSALADIMNQRMIDLAPRLPAGCDLVAQIHDACVYDVPDAKVDSVKALIQEMWDEPVSLPGGPLVLPIDLKDGSRWSEL